MNWLFIGNKFTKSSSEFGVDGTLKPIYELLFDRSDFTNYLQLYMLCPCQALKVCQWKIMRNETVNMQNCILNQGRKNWFDKKEYLHDKEPVCVLSKPWLLASIRNSWNREHLNIKHRSNLFVFLSWMTKSWCKIWTGKWWKQQLHFLDIKCSLLLKFCCAQFD